MQEIHRVLELHAQLSAQTELLRRRYGTVHVSCLDMYVDPVCMLATGFHCILHLFRDHAQDSCRVYNHVQQPNTIAHRYEQSVKALEKV